MAELAREPIRSKMRSRRAINLAQDLLGSDCDNLLRDIIAGGKFVSEPWRELLWIAGLMTDLDTNPPKIVSRRIHSQINEYLKENAR